MKLILIFLLITFYSINTTNTKLKTHAKKLRLILPINNYNKTQLIQPIRNDTNFSSINMKIENSQNSVLKVISFQTMICISILILFFFIIYTIYDNLKEKERKAEFSRKFAEILSSENYI